MRLSRKLQLGHDYEGGGGLYHCVSRVVWRQFIFGKVEKNYFRWLMRRFERYCGVEVRAYCLMSNHFHILVRVPARPTEVMEDEVFLRHLSLIYSEVQVADVRAEIDRLRSSEGEFLDEGGVEKMVEQLKLRFTRRMWDLSEFIKAVKQNFTLWFNKRNDKVGTLWEGRFKSVKVQGGYAAQLTAAYIDLNPVRAGIVKDPADYSWCSYGEALGLGKNKRLARQGLLKVMNRCEKGVIEETDLTMTQTEALRQYRLLLAEEGKALDSNEPMQLGENSVKRMKKAKGLSAEQVESIQQAKGELSPGQLLRCKLRYFTDGGVIGTREFVDKTFAQLKQQSGAYEKRKTGARRMKYLEGVTLFCLRNLCKDVKG